MAFKADLSGNLPAGAPGDGDPVIGNNKSVLGPDVNNATIIAAIGAASVQSAVMPKGVSQVRLVPAVDCYYKIGTNPTATANDVPLYQKQVEFVDVRPGDKIAVIQNGAVTGNLFITPVR